MRMWMLDPKILCKDHLYGEHFELHKLLGAIHAGNNKKNELHARIEKGQIDPHRLKERHDRLVEEAARRGYPMGDDHGSPIQQPDTEHLPEADIDKAENLRDLGSRCIDCFCRCNLSNP